MTKTYIEIYYPGVFVSETSIKEVPNRMKIDWPQGAYGYRFFEREEVTTPDGEVLKGAPKNYSGTYYAGEVYTLEEVKSAYPNERTLIANMECNGWDKVVKTVRGTWRPFESNDQIVRL